MGNSHFRFKKFTINQDRSVFKVGTDGVILGAAADICGTSEILDIGAGTGLISIMLAQRSNANITAIEPDTESFSQLSENVTGSPWNDRISILNTTLQEFKTGKKFDLIVSNPPYFISSLKSPDPRKNAARHWDLLPHSDLVKCVCLLLSPGGKFQVIMPRNEGQKLVAEALSHLLFLNSVLNIKPGPSSEVKRILLTFSFHKTDVLENNLIIEAGERHKYSEDYINLTKDFYLKF
ncbi:MAG TPA: methyltransferase [Bacteroidales bacterium]|nr:methyltransferase [Bacteroidales bacterium]